MYIYLTLGVLSMLKNDKENKYKDHSMALIITNEVS